MQQASERPYVHFGIIVAMGQQHFGCAVLLGSAGCCSEVARDEDTVLFLLGSFIERLRLVQQHLASIRLTPVDDQGARHAKVYNARYEAGHADVVALDVAVQDQVVVQKRKPAKNLQGFLRVQACVCKSSVRQTSDSA